MFVMFLLMIRPPPRSTLPDTLVPYPMLFRSQGDGKSKARVLDNPPFPIIIAKLPDNGFAPQDNPEILMAIDLNGLSAKELDTLITKAKARKTTLQKRNPVATVRSKMRQLAEAEGSNNGGPLGGRATKAAETHRKAPQKARNT